MLCGVYIIPHLYIYICVCIYIQFFVFLRMWNFMLCVSVDLIVHLIYLGNLFMSEHVYLSH